MVSVAPLQDDFHNSFEKTFPASSSIICFLCNATLIIPFLNLNATQIRGLNPLPLTLFPFPLLSICSFTSQNWYNLEAHISNLSPG